MRCAWLPLVLCAVGFAQTKIDYNTQIKNKPAYIQPSVMDFGAVGDGSTDDTGAIVAAMASLGTAGGDILMPRGTYKITGTISIPIKGRLMMAAGVTINTSVLPAFSMGLRSALVGAGINSTSIVGSTGLSGGPYITATDLISEYIVLQGFLIEANSRDNAGVIGIKMQGALYYDVRDVRIRNAETGIKVGGNGNCACYNHFYSVQVQGSYTGVWFSQTAIANYWFGGSIQGVGLTGNNGIIIDTASQNNTLYSPTIENFQGGTGIIVKSGGNSIINPYLEVGVTGISLQAKGNMVIGGGTFASLTGGGIDASTLSQADKEDNFIYMKASAGSKMHPWAFHSEKYYIGGSSPTSNPTGSINWTANILGPSFKYEPGSGNSGYSPIAMGSLKFAVGALQTSFITVSPPVPGTNNSKTITLPQADGTLALLENNQTFGATQTFNNVTISGTCTGCASGSGVATIKDEGTALTNRLSLNFIGSAVSCVDNAGSVTTDCTVAPSPWTTSGTAVYYNNPVWVGATVTDGTGFKLQSTNLSIASALRLYAGASDGVTTESDLRVNDTTGEMYLSAKSTGAVNVNFDHGTGGLKVCNGSGTCPASISSAGLITGSGAGLTAGSIPIAALTAGSYSAIITSGTYSGISIGGNAATATALIVDPSACGAGQFVSDIAANGTLTCAVPPAGTGLTSIKEEGVAVTGRNSLNFIGTDITCVDNAGTTTTDCTVTPDLWTASGLAAYHTNPVWVGAAVTDGTGFALQSTNLSVSAALRLYSDTAADGVTTQSDIRVNDTTGNMYISGKSTGAVNINFDHGTGGLKVCNGSGTCPGSISSAGLITGSGAGLTAGSVPINSLTAGNYSAIITAGTYSGISAGTAAALTADPAACPAGEFASDISAAGVLTCSVPPAGTGLTSLKEEGVALTGRNSLNFIGPNITCVDNAGTTTTDCTVATYPWLTSGSALYYNNPVWINATADDGTSYKLESTNLSIASALRLYAASAADGVTTESDIRVNDTTGEMYVSAKTGSVNVNFDKGTGGLKVCNGSGTCPGSISSTGVITGSGAGLSVGSIPINALTAGNYSSIVNLGTYGIDIGGNAATATALAVDPTACAAGDFVSDIDANGTLTCGTPAGGGGGTGTPSGLACGMTRTSSTVITMFTGASASAPCNVGFGSTTFQFTAAATFTISSGVETTSVFVYVDSAGVLTVGHNGTAGNYACSGCTATAAITAYPADVVPIATIAETTGAFAAAVGTQDKRAFLNSNKTVAGAGLTEAYSAGVKTLTVDSAVIGQRVAVPATLTSTCTANDWAADATWYYVCRSTDTWGRVAIDGSVPRVKAVTTSSSDTLTCSTIGATTETAFATSYTIAANTLVAGKVFRLTPMFQYTATAVVPTFTLRMRAQKSGPTNVNLVNPVGSVPTAGTNQGGGSYPFMLIGTAAAGASVNVFTSTPSNGTNATANMWFNRNTTAQPVAIATNADEAVQFTLECSTNVVGNSVTLQALVVEELN